MIQTTTLKMKEQLAISEMPKATVTDMLTGVTRELPQPDDVYKHFKGDLYVIIGVATHTESDETLVIYGREHKTWARPLRMFMSEVDHEKYPDVEQKYRFERCE